MAFSRATDDRTGNDHVGAAGGKGPARKKAVPTAARTSKKGNAVQQATAPSGGGHELLPQLRGRLPDLVPSKRRVAELILADPPGVANFTIGELAAAAHTSVTTVMRLCHDMGIGGYRSLRVTLAAESGRANAHGEGEIGSDIERTDSLDDVIRTITRADSAAVLETGELVDRTALVAAIDAVAHAGRIDIFGVGASSFVAMDLQQKLHRIGLISFCWADQHAALTAAALLAPGDAAIGISHTGQTRDTVDIVRRAGARGATTIAISAAPLSPLAAAADHALITASRETTFRSGAMASRIAALTVVDILFVGIAQSHYDRTVTNLEATRRAVEHRRFDNTTRGAS